MLKRHLWTLVFGLGHAGLAAASVTYGYLSSPVTVGYDSPVAGYSSAASLAANAGIGAPTIAASITFATALPSSSTIAIGAEPGGYQASVARTGGVVAFNATAFNGVPDITSTVSQTGAGPDFINVNLWSTVTGTMTTDAAGGVTAWDLFFTVYRVPLTSPPHNYIWTGPGAPPPGFPGLLPGTPFQGIHLNSASSLLQELNLGSVDGDATNHVLIETVYDLAFVDSGSLQVRRFSTAPGRWGSDAPQTSVPLPSGFAALMAGGLALSFAQRMRRRFLLS